MSREGVLVPQEAPGMQPESPEAAAPPHRDRRSSRSAWITIRVMFTDTMQKGKFWKTNRIPALWKLSWKSLLSSGTSDIHASTNPRDPRTGMAALQIQACVDAEG